MSALNLATKYAQSLFDVVGSEDRQKTLKEMQQLTTVFTPDVISFFTSPHNLPENKKSALIAACLLLSVLLYTPSVSHAQQAAQTANTMNMKCACRSSIWWELLF